MKDRGTGRWSRAALRLMTVAGLVMVFVLAAAACGAEQRDEGSDGATGEQGRAEAPRGGAGTMNMDTAVPGSDSGQSDHDAGTSGEGSLRPSESPSGVSPGDPRTRAGERAASLLGADVVPAGGDSITGVVQVTGSTPMTWVVLQVEGGPAVRLVGTMEDELRRLAGTVVAVTGEPTADIPGNVMDVEGYRVVSVDGRPVHVGVLVEKDGQLGLRTEAKESPIPISVPGALRDRAGAKVWIAGDVLDGALRVQSYGIIRP